ncbi:MAG: hypothetical protein ACRC0G_04475 [Fusobacteriaceae bacterium]
MLSYGEKLLRMYVKRCFPKQKQLFNFRDAGIINPTTGRSLEIDIYLPDIKIGFEFNGRQHKTDESQRERDKVKRKKCKELGITLVEIWAGTFDKDLYEVFEKSITNCKEMKRPPSSFLLWFKNQSKAYKENIYSMNKKIKSPTFVARRKK